MSLQMFLYLVEHRRTVVAKWFLFPLTSITLMKKLNGTEDPNILQNIIFCVIQKKIIQVWNNIECEYMTEFSYFGGLLL